MADRPIVNLIAGHPALDFLNALTPAYHERRPALMGGADLVEWIEGTGLASSEFLEAVVDSRVPGELDGVAAQARALGEWFRVFVGRLRGQRLPANALTELEPLNRLLAGDMRFEQLAISSDTSLSPLVLKSERRRPSPGSILLPIAEAMADLVCNEDFSCVRQCEGTDCTLLFVDRTRARARRWCSMAACGNRAKQEIFRKAANENR